MNCGECRHWKPTDNDNWMTSIRLTLKEGEKEEDRWDHSSALHARQVEAEKKFGRCTEVSLLEDTDEVDGDDLPLAFTRDASQYVANLYTQAEFGCLEFERKDT